jgi:hypothetical protein
LGVPDPVANEMAADLTADLEEAAAEGGSPEDVLGVSAFDPRRFAAAWAVAQGVTGPPTPERPSFLRSPLAAVLAVVVGVLIVGAGLVLVVGRRSSSFAVVAHRIAVVPGPIRVTPTGPGRFGQFGPFVVSHSALAGLQVLAPLVLLAGVVGIGLLAVLCWLAWPSVRRFNRRGGGQPPSWH